MRHWEGDMSYPGGKGASGVHQKIINQMPPHDIFIDGCFGESYVAQKSGWLQSLTLESTLTRPR